jgi:recombination protein RecT
MSTAQAITQAKSVHPMETLRAQFNQRADEFKRALPVHIPVERFVRVILTACSINPELLTVNRQSLWIACMRAAHDGLLPDGREGVILGYRDSNPRSSTHGQTIAQWQPMIGGLLKRFRNSGQFRSITAGIVREGEPFEYWIDEKGEHLRHTPGDDGKPIKAYAIANTKDGGTFIRVMSAAEINKRRAVSKAKDGPMWREWWDEAAMKTVLRNLSKRLPSSSDLDELMRRDDDEEAFAPRPEATRNLPAGEAVDLLEQDDVDSRLGEETTREQFGVENMGTDTRESDPNTSDNPERGQSDVDRAFAEGVDARKGGHARRAVPGPYREPQASHLAKAWWNGWDSAEQRS